MRCSQSRLEHNHGRNPLAAANRLFKQTEPESNAADKLSLICFGNRIASIKFS